MVAVAGCSSHRIRAVAMSGATTALADTGGCGHEDGPVATASFAYPTTTVFATPVIS